MKLLKKILVCLVIASLVLGVISSIASAQGPVGAPPTQNVSPTFSDVNVKGGINVGSSGMNKIIENIFAINPQTNKPYYYLDINSNSSIRLNAETIVEGFLKLEEGLMGNLLFKDDITLAKDKVIKSTPGQNVKVSGNLELVNSGALIANGIQGTLLGIETILVNSSPAIGGLLDIVSTYDVNNKGAAALHIQELGIADKWLAIDRNELAVYGDNLYINKDTKTNVYIGDASNNSNLRVYGHLMAKTVGKFFQVTSNYFSIPANGIPSANAVSCPKTDQIVVSCGFNFYNDKNGNEYKGNGITQYALMPHGPNNAGDYDVCTGGAYNSTASTKYIKLSAVCFDPDGAANF